MTTIVLDAMGSDNYPDTDVRGAVMAAQEYDLDLILVGDEKQIRQLLESLSPNDLPIRIVHAPEMLTMDDKGDDLVRWFRHGVVVNAHQVCELPSQLGYDYQLGGRCGFCGLGLWRLLFFCI